MLHVALVEPEIHWNTGNAGRSCLAAGAQLHLVQPLGFSLDDRAVRRAGLDYWPRVNPRVWSDWQTFDEEVDALGEAYYFSADGSRDLWQVEYPRDVVLVFGTESVGLPAPMREKNQDRLLRIPMHPDSARSLNLSTCVGIVLWEVLRQQSREQGS